MTARTRRGASAEPAETTDGDRDGNAAVGSSSLTADDVGKMTVVALREALSARGLATDGLKAALAERLRESVDAEGTRGTKRKENATTGVDGAEGETGKRATKRRRWDEDPAETNAAATEGKSEASATKDAAAAVKAKAKAALDKAALLKQKEALLKQKELAAKLKAKKLGDAAKGKAAAPPPPAKKPSARPMALRLDAQGREIDENGELVKTKVIETSTLRMNLKQQRADAFAQAQAEAQAELAAQASEYDDPRMGKFAGRSRKPRSTLQVRVRFFFFLFYTFSPLRENCASFKAPWLSHDMRHGDYKNAKLKGLRSNTHREHFTRA
jgi:hypothetical protein